MPWPPCSLHQFIETLKARVIDALVMVTNTMLENTRQECEHHLVILQEEILKCTNKVFF